MTKLDKLKDDLMRGAFKMTVSEARAQGVCVRCYSDAGRREYGITGLCELCFDEIATGR
ncbi:hypothetical protein LCGC14_2353710 [marine sediment metagenome]|uniref:Uncharacterized protein n=1 Tax=marine sediment metagenome TaxID=412755 RepID=A0A0F9C8W9_9ZZZZ